MTKVRMWVGLVAALGCVACVMADGAAKPEHKDMPTAAPEGATILLGTDPADVGQNWYRRGSKDPAGWTMAADGTTSPTDKKDITSAAEFGDCFLHCEFRCPEGHGNAGVAFMGRYEVQIYNSFGQQPSKQGVAAFYNQVAPTYVASKPAGEWQTYDITFRAPRLDADGKVTEKARATVIHNGYLVQDDVEFQGPTGIQYGDFKGEVAVAPIVLQGNHDAVDLRNIWVVPAE